MGKPSASWLRNAPVDSSVKYQSLIQDWKALLVVLVKNTCTNIWRSLIIAWRVRVCQLYFIKCAVEVAVLVGSYMCVLKACNYDILCQVWKSIYIFKVRKSKWYTCHTMVAVYCLFERIWDHLVIKKIHNTIVLHNAFYMTVCIFDQCLPHLFIYTNSGNNIVEIIFGEVIL